MPKLILDGKHETEIRTAVQQLNIPCKIIKQIIQRRNKRADKVIVDIAADDAIGLPLAMDAAVPIGGWSAYSYSNVGANRSDVNAASSDVELR